ncbi:hypothetical protein CcCBS67573_g05503 [Chytriomyces confervae]|uniref:ABC transporter domain-containing protein n=1 Tax=Chytriomyces confervae TaxID=246404 RepID=A0A507FA68_9FUNG|nr:hypothetical protein CcCBS67573_g05503 [Chytriomyces confervae]
MSSATEHPGSVTVAVPAAAAADMEKPGVRVRKANQLKALSRKTISYQKRQMFTNVCCICLCPLMMVLISAILGKVINDLIARSQTVEDIQYCSNNNSLVPIGWPIYNQSEPGVYGVDVPNGKSVNYLRYISFAKLANPGAAALGAKKPCVYWFGTDFPKNSDIYERNANLTGLAKLDSTYIPPVDEGWSGQLQKLLTNPKSFDATSFRYFSGFQTSGWSVAGSAPELAAVFGTKPNGGNVPFTALATFNASALTTPSFNPSTGLLGSIAQRIYINVSINAADKNPLQLKGAQLYPYYETSDKLQTADAIDDAISKYLNNLIADLATLNKTILLVPASQRTVQDLTSFQLNAGAVLSKMPSGGLFLESFDASSLRLKIVLSYGTDVRVSSSANFPTQGFRQLVSAAQLGQAALRAFVGQNDTLQKATVTQGIRAFPFTKDTALTLPFGGLIGRILYPFGVSFLLPIFVIMLVKEKEDRIYIMMKMNGVKSWAYYITHYVTFFVLFIFSTLVFIVVGRVTKLDMFTKTAPFVLIALFFLWGNVQIALAFLLATLFSKSRIALVMTFLVVLVGVVISLVLSDLYEDSFQFPVLNIWPPFAFYRGLSLMNTASYTEGSLPFGNSQFAQGTEFRSICGFLFFEIFAYGALAAYMNAVVPTEFGVARPWHFPITDLIALSQSKQRSKANGGVDPKAESAMALSATKELDSREDDDVRAERARIDNTEFDPSSPIIMSHMRKVYAGRKGLGPKVAVRDVTFAAESGVIFGLLGPNGAGKTTLINILTGLYEASAGHARLAGFDIKTQQAMVYNNIGVCPQFDILWEDLTARLKGVESGGEASAVEKSLEQVSLTALKHRLSKNLSGGEKRRLSIAIALVGNPAVVFLDEPTTGLDPEVRRLIWNIIQNARGDKTIILTTHSMEEAEALCQRIGIMAKGSLRCMAQPLRLKELYGTGFKLSFHSLSHDTERASRFIESVLPVGWKKIDAFSTNTAYEFPAAANSIPKLFETIEEQKTDHGVLQWGISQTTLEEVFLRIITDDDANAD